MNLVSERYPGKRRAVRAERKGLLICPHCDHESTFDGDWRQVVRRTEQGRRLAYECPDCDNDITYRMLPKDIAAGVEDA